MAVLPEPPMVRESLKREISFFVETLQSKGADVQKGGHAAEIIDYALDKSTGNHGPQPMTQPTCACPPPRHPGILLPPVCDVWSHTVTASWWRSAMASSDHRSALIPTLSLPFSPSGVARVLLAAADGGQRPLSVPSSAMRRPSTAKVSGRETPLRPTSSRSEGSPSKVPKPHEFEEEFSAVAPMLSVFTLDAVVGRIRKVTI